MSSESLPKKPKYKVTERQFEAAVETFGSVDEAYRHLDVTPEEVDFGPLDAPATPTISLSAPTAPTTPNIVTTPNPNTPPPIVVHLLDRVAALEDIVAYLNKANKTHGSAIQMESGGGEFADRYGRDAETVQQGAEAKTHELLAKYCRAIGVLAAVDALRANGYDEEDIQLHYISVQAEVNKDLGIGRAYAKDRHRALKKARLSAEHLK